MQNPVGTHSWIPIDTPYIITYEQAISETEKWNALQENILTGFIYSISHWKNHFKTEIYSQGKDYFGGWPGLVLFPKVPSERPGEPFLGNWQRNLGVNLGFPGNYLVGLIIGF